MREPLTAKQLGPEAGTDPPAAQTDGAMRPSRPETLLLLGILVVATLLRFAGIGSDLPHVVGPDEHFEIQRALRLGMGEFDFERIAKGGFFYLLFFEYGLYYLFLRLTGQIADAAQFAEHFARDLTPFWLIGRVTHAALGVVAVAVTHLLGRRCYGPPVGLFGAAVVAVSPLCVSRSALVGVDVPMALLALIALWLMVDWPETAGRGHAIMVGASIGLAAMTKLPAATLIVPLVVTVYLRQRSRPSRALRAGARELGTVGVAAAIVFVLGNPGFVLKFKQVTLFVLRTAMLDVGPKHPDDVYTAAGTGENLFAFYLRVLRMDFGLALTGLALAGLALALVKRRREDLVLVSFAVAFFLVIAVAQTTHLYYSRYFLPLIPPLALLAGRLVWRAASLLPLRSGWRSLAASVVGAAALVPLVSESAEAVSRRLRVDTRIVARDWIEAEIPAESTVFLVGNSQTYTAPNLSVPLRNSDANLARMAREFRPQERSKSRFLELRRKVAQGVPYDLRTARHFEPVPSLAELRTEGVEYCVLVGHLFDPERLERDSKRSGEILSSRARLRQELRSGDVAELILRVDPEEKGLAGQWVEVYRLAPREVGE